MFRVWIGVPSPKFHDQVVIRPVEEELADPSNFSVAPAANTSPLGLCTLMVKIAEGPPPVVVTVSVKVAVWVTAGLPPVALIVTVLVPAVAVEDAVSVTVAEHVGLQGLLLKAEAVTPVGSVEVMPKVTGAVVPETRVAVAVSTPPAPPAVMVRVDGVAARVKSNAAGVTTRLKVAVLVTPPPTAWIVMVVVEAGAVADAVRVTVAEQVGLQLAGVNALAVTPVGSAVVMLKVTGVVTPATRVADAVSTPPAEPATMVRVAGVAARL